jgi:hypothetical protein
MIGTVIAATITGSFQAVIDGSLPRPAPDVARPALGDCQERVEVEVFSS